LRRISPLETETANVSNERPKAMSMMVNIPIKFG